MAKRQTKRRQELVQRRRKKRNQQMIVGVSIIGVVILVAAFVYYVVLDREAPLPDGVETAYADFDQSIGSENYTGVLGREDAPVEVREYSSFACPHCKNLQPEIKRLHPYIEAGHVRLVFVPIYDIAGPTADPGARAAICAGQQGMFWEMHDVLFYWQGRENYGDRLMRSAADQLGMDADSFMDCFGSGETRSLIRSARAEFARRGFNATPVVLVNNIESSNVVADVETQLRRLGLLEAES